MAAQFGKCFNQFPAFRGQMGAGFPIGLNHLDLEVFFGGFDFTPHGFVGHLQGLGRLVDRTGTVDGFENFHAAFAENDTVILIHNPMTGP